MIPGTVHTLMLVATVAGSSPAAAAPAHRTQQLMPADSTYGCVICHADKRRAFQQGVHAERGITCDACHGGDPSQVEVAPAHRGRFVGAPGKLETLRLCSTCHADPDQMRQFGLSADQLAEFRTSRHGQLLITQGNMDAPTCTDCHDAHLIRPSTDARSNTHPTNIPATCGRCHDDAALMGKYGLPSDQLARYREGAHGVAVFQNRNFAAPTCTGCHGSHAALPPGIAQVTDVCGRCHLTLERAFAAGPHGRAAAVSIERGCLGCHSNHGTERVAPDAIADLCASCHGAESQMVVLGGEIQEQVQRAEEDLTLATEAIEEMAAEGHPVEDERFRYVAAFTAFQQLAEVQHSLSLEELEDLGRQVRSNTSIIRSTAEARAEERWEHKLLLIPLWFLALSGIAFASFKLRELGR
jgi:predicted CXXCH cytochrome family protein